MTIHGNYKRRLTRVQTRKLQNLLDEIESGHMLSAKTVLLSFIETEGFTSRGK